MPIPDESLRRHPQLEQINAAIAESKQSGVVTAHCPKCDEEIQVAEVPGRLVTGCRCGYCRCSVRFEPS